MVVSSAMAVEWMGKGALHFIAWSLCRKSGRWRLKRPNRGVRRRDSVNIMRPRRGGLGSVARDARVVARKKENLVTWGPSAREGKKQDQTRSEVKLWLAPGPRVRDLREGDDTW